MHYVNEILAKEVSDMYKDKSICEIENMYFMALENSYDEIFITDANGITIYCNPAFEEQYGYRVDEVIGTSNFFEENNIFEFSPEQTTLKSKEATTIEKMMPSGKKLWITTKPVFDQDGSLKYIVGNSRDLSKIEEMKNELESYKEKVNLYQSEIELLKKEKTCDDGFDMFKNESFIEIIKKIHRVSSKDASILILGESGTGKSYFAKFIHNNSLRKEEKFITVDCSSLHESLIESELFGYVDGAFTGARKGGKAGLIDAAEGGSLFLDEIGEMPMRVQAKLLRLIQEKEFIPVGGSEVKHANVRILAATNRNLSSMVDNKEFRSDLYYRLKIVELELPPLRERREDISYFSNYFIHKLNKQYNSKNYLSKECMKYIVGYEWSGNIRELRNVIEQMIIFAECDEIRVGDLPERIPSNSRSKTTSDKLLLSESKNSFSQHDNDSFEFESLDERIENLEREIVLDSYERLGSSVAVASELAISQSKAYRKIAKYTDLANKTKSK